MPSDAQILDEVRRVFASCERPVHFTNYTHCCECAEHDEVLLSRDLDTLSMQDVGSGAWDPICFISPEGFAYYLPALARLALSEPLEPHGWYGPQFFFHLNSGLQADDRIRVCTADQRCALVRLLHHILETRASLADQYLCSSDLLNAIERWSGDSDTTTC